MNRLLILPFLLMVSCITVVQKDTETDAMEVRSGDLLLDGEGHPGKDPCDPTDPYTCPYARECIASGPAGEMYCECAPGWRCGDLTCPGVICNTCDGDPLTTPGHLGYMAKDDPRQCCTTPTCPPTNP